MKRLLVLACAVGVLVSCASLPEPEGPGNSLVIGSFVLDFPNGFFDLSARSITSGVTLSFRNVTQDKKFTLTTVEPGFFYFLANGSDEYLFESYKYNTEKGTSGTYTLGERPVKIKIVGVPDKVVYLGHISKVYAAAKLSRAYGDQSSTWKFQESISTDWVKDSVTQFIADRNPDSRWLAHEIVEYGKK